MRASYRSLRNRTFATELDYLEAKRAAEAEYAVLETKRDALLVRRTAALRALDAAKAEYSAVISELAELAALMK